MYTSSKTLANTILQIANSRPETRIDHMKLQKLMYFSHGWHLALVGRPLAIEGFEAWDYGPVNRPVYSEFRRFGASPITSYALEYGTDDKIPQAYVINKAYEETYKVIHAVWEKYSPFTALQLSEMTHQRGTPWWSVRESSGTTIPDSEIKRYFTEQMAASAAQ